MRLRTLVDPPPKFASPQFLQNAKYVTDRPSFTFVRTKIPRSRKTPGIVPELLRQHQISTQRIKHMLPRAHRVGISNEQLALLTNGSHNIRNNSIFRPVSPANDVSSAGRRYASTNILSVRSKKRPAIRGG